MAAKMKVNDFLFMLGKAYRSKTLYVMGGWGYPLNADNKKRAINNDTTGYNRKPERKNKINAASSDTFAFDCCGLAKAVLWGWNADASKKNGGASYAANGVPDYDAKELMFKGCTEQSKDWGKIEAGEFLWLDGHCGVYMGDGLAIESTPKWKDGVQITAVANIGKKSGYESRTWTYHGHLKYVDYAGGSKYPSTPFDIWVKKSGVTGMRATPYSDGKYLGTVTSGTYTVTEVSGDYGFIGKGWVYLVDDNVAIYDDTYKVGNDYKVTCSELNMRADVGTGARIITELHRGDVVTCREVKRDASGNVWMKVDGWIACKYEGDTYVQ